MNKNSIQENIIKHNFKVSKQDREKLNQQKAVVIWFIGLSGSGKSTIANQIEVVLHQNNYQTYILDGDNTRQGINKDLDFSKKSRIENIRRVGEIAKLFTDAGIITLCSFITPFQEDREKLKNVIGKENFIEVYVHCPLEVCEQRDVKGLYAKARKGEIKNFTGIDSPFQEPQNPNIIVHSHQETLEESTQKILTYLNQNKVLEL